MIIYKATNKINGKVYIGQTIRTLKVRINCHLRANSHYPFGNALRKYGIENFDIKVIDEALTKEELNEKEIYWIKFYDCQRSSGHGYNITAGGDDNPMNYPELREKSAKANRGLKRSEETIAKLRILGKAGKGRKCSDEGREHIAEAKRAEKSREDHSKKMKEWYQDPDNYNAQVERTRTSHGTPEFRDGNSKRKTEYWSNEDNREAQSKRLKELRNTPEWRHDHSEKMKEYWRKRKEEQQKILEGRG